MSKVWVGIQFPGLSPQAKPLSAARSWNRSWPQSQTPGAPAGDNVPATGLWPQHILCVPQRPFCLHLFYFCLVTCDQEKLHRGCWTIEQPVRWHL